MRLTASSLLRRSFAAAGLLMLASCLAFAQSGVATADLTGVVTDSQGGVVPGATVTLRNVDTNIERTVTTNADGRYTLSGVPPANYELTISAQGFKKLQTSGLQLTVGQSAELDLALEVALSGSDTEVTIVAGTELIETTRTSVASTVDRNEIENLPINGRSFLNFTLTSSTIVRDNSPSIGPAPTAGLNAGGQRARSNNVSIDGADNNDNSVNGVRGAVSQEAVQEFQLITNSYAPEFGRASGAVVNIITKSGSNDFHGNVFGFFRHRSFQARNAFAISDDPAYTRAQYGATFGGPIKKDRTFFFMAFEQSRRQETAFSVIARDPAIFNLTGDQTAFASNPNVFDAFGLTDAFLASLGLNQAALAPLTAPLTLLRGNAETGLTGAFGLTSFIAANGFGPNGAFFPSGAAIPRTYVPLAGYDPATGFPLNGEFPISDETTLFSVRVDHQFNSNNNFTARYNYVPNESRGNQSNAQNQVYGQNALSRTARNDSSDQAIAASNTTTFGDGSFINEARFQFAHRRVDFLPECGNNPDCTDFNASQVAVNINGVGYFGREPFAPVLRTEKRIQFSDNLSWLKGSHSFKFGGDYNHIPVEAIFQLNFGGVYNFGELPGSVFFQPGTSASNALTLITTGLAASLIGNGVPPDQAQAIARSVGFQMVASVPGLTAVQAYGLGVPQNLIQGFGDDTSKFSNNQIGFFAQDSWRIRPNFTFNYGVRYDVETPPEFPPLTDVCPTCGAAEEALNIQQGFPSDKNNWQPRIAIAWDPWSDGKTVIRAAYGLFYDHPLLAAAFNSNIADGAQAPQLVLDPGTAARVFQGIPIPGLPAGSQLLDQQRFDPAVYPGAFSPLLPFTLHIDRDFEYGYSQQANLTIEREIVENFSASAAYLWVRGLHLNRPRDRNTPDVDLLIRNRDRAVALGLVPPGTNPSTVAVFAPAQGVVPAALFNFFRPSGPNYGYAETIGIPAAQLAAIASSLGLPLGPGVYVPFGPVIAQDSTGKSDYHALTLGLNKRFSHGYQFSASYTWSHAIDDSTDLQTLLAPQDNNRLDLERGNSYFDQRHRFVFSGVFASPYTWKDEGFWKKFLADFTFSPIVELSSGRPFNVHSAADTNFDFSSQTDRPNVVSPGSSAPAGVDVFNTPAGTFYLPGSGETGSLGRTTGTRPGYASVDFRLTRRIELNDRITLELIGECFNLFNRVNIIDVNNNYTVAGTPTAAADPRQFQFGAKIAF
ncbi:MAG: TonB-dependent receptor [Blastocatellia bacterium]